MGEISQRMPTWLYRLLRCRHVTSYLPNGRDWRCERWLHFGSEHR